MAKMFYTMDEAIAALEKSEDEIKQYANEGRLRVFRDGPRMMFKADQVENLKDEVSSGIPPRRTVAPALFVQAGPQRGVYNDTARDTHLTVAQRLFLIVIATGGVFAYAILSPYYYLHMKMRGQNRLRHGEGQYLLYLLSMIFGVCIYLVVLPILTYWLITHRIHVVVEAR